MLLPTVVIVALSAAPAVAPHSAIEEFDDWAARPHEKFDSGSRTFEAVRRELAESYVNSGLSDEDLYRAAVQGMLSNIDPAMKKYNRLISPAEFAEMNLELKAQVAGVGVVVKFDAPTGRAEILDIVPNSPAAKTDLKAGDVILTVDGQSFKGKQMHDLVYAIRGKVGEKVSLGVLHDNAVVTRSLERQNVAFDVVEEQSLPGDIALLQIHSFAEPTAAQAKAALARIAASRAKGLIIDLRDNPGGLLDSAEETARLLLPKGKTIVKLKSRGGKEETVTTTTDPVLAPLPTVVLMNATTGSSAEMLAAALRDGLHAPLIGQKSRGKWSVQALKELPNKFVMRYTVAHFQAPDGKSYEGEGLSPDIEVAFDDDAMTKAERVKGAERLALDPQLKAGASFLRMR